MPTPEPLDVTFTPEAKAQVLAFLRRVTDYPPILTLMKGRASGDTEDRWTYGVYGPKNIGVVEPMLKEHGYPLIYMVDDLLVAIPQPQFIPELVGKNLGLASRGLAVQDRTNGI